MMIFKWAVRLLMLGVIISLGSNVWALEDSNIVETGSIYIENDGNSWTAATQIPTTLPYNIITVTPRKDPDGDGTTVIGYSDFLVKKEATPDDQFDYKYWFFSQNYMPCQIVGTSRVYPNGVFIANTPNASSSGDSAPVGQWFEWFTEILSR